MREPTWTKPQHSQRSPAAAHDLGWVVSSSLMLTPLWRCVLSACLVLWHAKAYMGKRIKSNCTMFCRDVILRRQLKDSSHGTLISVYGQKGNLLATVSCTRRRLDSTWDCGSPPGLPVQWSPLAPRTGAMCQLKPSRTEYAEPFTVIPPRRCV